MTRPNTSAAVPAPLFGRTRGFAAIALGAGCAAQQKSPPTNAPAAPTAEFATQRMNYAAAPDYNGYAYQLVEMAGIEGRPRDRQAGGTEGPGRGRSGIPVG